MCLITVFLSLLVFLAAGCATSAKKQTTDTRSAAYEKTQKTYQSSAPIFDYADEGSQASGSYGPPAEKTASGLNTQLSTKQVQRALKNSGFYKGEIDGKIGPKTKEAIIKFQKAHGLNGDGMVGKKTSSELRNYLSK